MKVEVAFFGTATPACALISDGDLPERERVMRVMLVEFAMHEFTSAFLVFVILNTRTDEGASVFSPPRANDEPRRKERAEFFQQNLFVHCGEVYPETYFSKM